MGSRFKFCKTLFLLTPKFNVARNQTSCRSLNTVQEKSENAKNNVTSLSEDHIFNTVVTANELCAYLGLAREFALEKNHTYTDKLTRIQMLIVDISNEIIKNSKQPTTISQFSKENRKEVDEWIKHYGESLPVHSDEEVLLPGGGKASCSLQIARNICQRVEKNVSTLTEHGVIDREIHLYLTKLGDFLMTISRFAAKSDKRSESTYTPVDVQAAQTESRESK